ncbi:MAG: DUF6528 family protein, partial [Tannerella sp.]|nr:DUF6528 family protein [Tannerella sp.]
MKVHLPGWMWSVAGCVLLAGSCAEGNDEAFHLLVCGEDRVFILDAATSEGERVNRIWQWQVSDLASQIPEAYQQYLPPVNDCKPVEMNGKCSILVTGGRAVVMLDRDTKQCLFYACTPNSHSVELLPDNRVVVALSIAEGGNSL